MRVFDVIDALLEVTVVGVACYPIYAYFEIYRLYKLAVDRLGQMGFIWFAVQVQSSGFGQGGRTLDALPQELQEKLASVRNRLRKSTFGLLLWLVSLVSLAFLVKGLSHG